MRRKNVSDLCSVFPLLILMMAVVVAGCEEHKDRGDDASEDTTPDVGSNSVNVVVCLGDSITSAEGRVPYTVTLGGLISKTAINGGKGGDRTGAAASRVGGLLRSHRPGYLTILLGSNDAIHGGSTEAVTPK